ncbi:type III secretion protein HrpB4 [Ramlibacter tataouinensis]|uniref:Uncharacterized protein n=1 Tax=Ramlibacter tataouinensis (strain ATCC BAA-407 / DSM 14655 / LMG 21543 / TTB310) TaxID=365046 RepID=F5XVY5_RAMTT|nr:type III secretion protein HrpB4 [Ramlibacter tataouinensis]AEG94088.1 hypothetical protein Rta_29840 [Ramlibacter tataouinensis TTB310]
MSPPADAVGPLRRLLAAVDRKAATLAADLHPAWIDAAWARLGPRAGDWAARLPPRRHSALLADAYGLAWPPLEAFREPAHRLALLDRDRLLRVLAACALEGRRDSVRRSVGRMVRQLLIEGIGESAYRKVLDSPAPGVQVSGPLDAREAGQDRLAEEGFRILCGQAAWRHPTLLTLVRLSLAPSASADQPADDRPCALATNGVDGTIDRLHEYFPELVWLFGSDMDRALSASRTASSAPATSRS